MSDPTSSLPSKGNQESGALAQPPAQPAPNPVAETQQPPSTTPSTQPAYPAQQPSAQQTVKLAPESSTETMKTPQLAQPTPPPPPQMIPQQPSNHASVHSPPKSSPQTMHHSSMSMQSTSSVFVVQPPVPGSVNWEPYRQRLLGNNLNEAIQAATDLKSRASDIGHSTDFPLFLSALLPAFSTVLAASPQSVQSSKSAKTIQQEHELRHAVLEIIRNIPMNETLRPHAPHLVAVAMDVLLSNTNNNMSASVVPATGMAAAATPGGAGLAGDNFHGCEENALQAAHIIFDLYKQYRSLPQENVQAFLDFVLQCYRALPNAVQRSFTKQSLMNASTAAMANTSPLSSFASPLTTNRTTLSLPSPSATPMTPAKPMLSLTTPGSSQRSLEREQAFAGGAIGPPPLTAAAAAAATTAATTAASTTTKDENPRKPPLEQAPPSSAPVPSSADPTSKTTTEPDESSKQQQQPQAQPQPPPPTPQQQQTNKPEQQPSTSTPHQALTVETRENPISRPITIHAPSPGQQHKDQMGQMSPQTPRSVSLFRSNTTFRVLTECPLIVMLMFQLYPKFMKTNIPKLIKEMTKALGLKAPSIQKVLPNVANTPLSAAGKPGDESPPKRSSPSNSSSSDADKKLNSTMKRMYFSRARDLISAQAKTLSFLTYLFRSFSNEIKPYEAGLAANVVALLSNCPHESISTRKELLVATRHLLSSDFRKGFFEHIDTLLDARVLMGSSSNYHYYHHYYYSAASYRFSDQTLLRPLGYTTLSDLIQHVRQKLTMAQVSKITSIFSRVLHDNSISMTPLPMSTQYTAVRTLLSLVDLIYNNKEPNPQVGRDMLCRMMETLVDKLHALYDYLPCVIEAEAEREALESSHRLTNNVSVSESSQRQYYRYNTSVMSLSRTPPDSIRDVQSMIRAIVVGLKSVIYYINNYRIQREKEQAIAAAPAVSGAGSQAEGGSESKPSLREQMMPPPGSNEEVSSAMLKLTNTEIGIIDRYILIALPALKLLDVGSASPASSTVNDIHFSGNHGSGVTATSGTDKTSSEHHRDALTHFAATFVTFDGHNLRRSLGKRINLLVDAVVEDPMAMVIPRHLLASNRATSYEFCNILLDYLVDQIDLLGYPKINKDIVFLEDQRLTLDHDVTMENSKEWLQMQLHKNFERPVDSDDRQKKRSTTILHLFERVLKSLAAYPDNEVVVRRHLRRIVVTCFRSAMENIEVWSDNYCMLLRYIFRSISAGKFEESYKELLPLIPTVLNGLCRVLSTTEDKVVRCTAIELCLTIPARLSSLLPHMNLLLRVIIPALDSSSGDLVNLGLRTLEFWVDNLNPLFLYPEVSKQTDLFSSLMQALSRHLRPAPYPYGLLTLRLLGKLGGKNRQFLRNPMNLSRLPAVPEVGGPLIECRWRCRSQEDVPSSPLFLTLPVNRCLLILKQIASSQSKKKESTDSNDALLSSPFHDKTSLWECKIEDLDLTAYNKKVVSSTMDEQAKACFAMIRAALRERSVTETQKYQAVSPDNNESIASQMLNVNLALFYSCTIHFTKDASWKLLNEVIASLDEKVFSESIAAFLSDSSSAANGVGLQILSLFLDLQNASIGNIRERLPDDLIVSLCNACKLNQWGGQKGLFEAILKVMSLMGREWSRKHEVMLINVGFLSIKTVPRELSVATMKAIHFFFHVCRLLYGASCLGDADAPLIDILYSDAEVDATTGFALPSGSAAEQEAKESSIYRPSDEVFRLLVYELACPQQLARVAARFLIVNVFGSISHEGKKVDFFTVHLSLIRRVLFSRSLRLLPLPHQVGVVEGLAVIMKQCPGVLPLSDQHLLAFLSELLKMASVADGEMTDETLKDHAVNKNGYTSLESDSDSFKYPTHSSSVFFRRECVVVVLGKKIIIPEELPAGVLLRRSTVVLLHSVILGYNSAFFDAELTTPVGNIRPHVISLLFRSLVSTPLKVVDAAHNALRDVLSLTSVTKDNEGRDEIKSQSRLPKELLQTCIRPVLLHLRDYVRLSPSLLRGLSRLLSLLSSWFNKTLGEKLLDHLKKWTDPGRIILQKQWRQGEEPFVAAAIVGIFSSLPHASHFVEPLVKTCIKLEATLPAYKSRLVESPYRHPLARYLNKHPQSAVSFFFQRLKTPMYSELFQNILEFEESFPLRSYLSNKQCSVMILNVCFERPLAIIRAEKSSVAGSSGKSSLSLHGIGSHPPESGENTGTTLRPMNTEALELQLQGFRLVDTFLANDINYFKDHNDIVRAFRWLWRSKGRFLRLQHEEMIPPRYHIESKMLASFLMTYAKSYPNDDLDVLFELIRVFLQPSTTDFSFTSRFLGDMVSHILSMAQKKKILARFFTLSAGENEEIKVMSMQFLVYPMLCFASRVESESWKTKKVLISEIDEKTESKESSEVLIDESIVGKFVKDVLFPQGSVISCGDRLKVEILRLLNLFVEFHSKFVENFRNEMVRFCWGLLKSEDTSCKGWAYVVVCRFIVAFETPANIVLQVYIALLRLHQQEGKELVRAALDILVPVLPKRLTENEIRKLVDQTSHMMFEDANSTHQLAHISQTIIRCPQVFYPYRRRYLAYMISSLNRLGLPSNTLHENRVLAIDIIELALDWSERQISSDGQLVSVEQMDSITNFLFRLKLSLIEHYEARISARAIEERANALFERVLTYRHQPTVRIAPLENILNKEQKSSGPLVTCLQNMSLMSTYKKFEFFANNSSFIEFVLNMAFGRSREDQIIRKELICFVGNAKDVGNLPSTILSHLEKILGEVLVVAENSEACPHGDTAKQGSPRSREKPTKTDDSNSHLELGLFALEATALLCRHRSYHLTMVSTILMSYFKIMAKSHLADATARQRQGTSSASRASVSGIRHHTPTVGILEAAFHGDPVENSRITAGKSRLTREDSLNLNATIRSLIVIFSIFESSNFMFQFGKARKTLLQIIVGIIDSSDNIRLIMVAVRSVGKLMASHESGSPFTLKEKNALLWKISSLDCCCLPDDVVAQPLTDIVGTFAKRFYEQRKGIHDAEMGKLIVTNLLHTNQKLRNELIQAYINIGCSNHEQRQEKNSPKDLLWRLLHSDFEGLGGRFWVVVFVDVLLSSVEFLDPDCINGIRTLAHADMSVCFHLLNFLLPAAWNEISEDRERLRLATAMEILLSRPFHNQFSLTRPKTFLNDTRCANAMRSFLNATSSLEPMPFFDSSLLVLMAENYNCWHEVLNILDQQYHALRNSPISENILSAMRHCYRQLGEEDMWMSLASASCKLPKSKQALSMDVYGLAEEAVSNYAELVELVESPNSQIAPSDFEMDMWEERFIILQKDLCQFEVVSEFATASANPRLQLECAWKSQDWSKVRSLCSSAPLLAAVENGDPIIKISETLLAVVDGKLADVENLHAQAAQLCLYKWQLLPRLSSGSSSHASLLHFFHRLVEIRESGQIMAETRIHANAKTLPDLKNLLNAWRHRLPNDWEKMSTWDEVFAWRAQMFSVITSNFQWSEPNTLATLHDRPWSCIRMAKTARKQNMRDVALLLLNKASGERAMNVSDAFLKLREQILAYYNLDSDLERHGGLNLINTTNLSFFDASQKSELFRLKASFLASLGGRSKANQAFCHSVQICPTHARAWDSWGELCGSLGAVAEKQLEQTLKGGDQDSKVNSAKKVAQYLAQAMGCYFEAVQIDAHEWARFHLGKCLWMLTKDGSSPGVLCQTFESRGAKLPAWVWLPWVPQLLTGLYRREGKAMKAILSQLVKSYPQAIYYPLRAFYLERRDVDRVQTTPPQASQHHGSVLHAEELMSSLRRSHASLWSSLESVLEELIVKFRPSYEEELLSTIIALLERVESQVGNIGKKESEETIVGSVWKTLKRIAVKFFRPTEQSAVNRDSRSKKTAEFKAAYKESFEIDFFVSATEEEAKDSASKLTLQDVLFKLRSWKSKLETHVLSTPRRLSLVEASHSLAMFGVGDAPDLWSGSCDPHSYTPRFTEHEMQFDTDVGTSQPSTSSSAAAARKAANTAASTAIAAASHEGISGDYGGGSSWIEVPGQYMPNTSSWTDIRPSPELHAKLQKFDPTVTVLRRNDQLVRQVGMIASDGTTYRFLLQFAVPYMTRTDERTSQTSYFLDKVFRRDIHSSRANISIQSHPVIPVAQRLRLISEPDYRNSLDDVHRLLCDREKSDHTKLQNLFNEEMAHELSEKASVAMTEEERGTLEKSIRRTVFLKIRSSGECDDTMLLNHLFAVLKGPEPVYHFRRIFAQQWATNCLLQYVFSITERTPCRVAFVECTGRVLSPEFRTSYSSQGYMDKMPLPFRLSPNLLSLIGLFLLDARFMRSFATAARAVHSNRDDVDPILKLLMRDDLVAFYTKSMAKPDGKTVDMEKQLAERVSRNVAVLHARFSECVPRSDKGKSNDSVTDQLVDQKIRDLVDAAQDVEKLCLMSSSYQGWV